MNKCNLPRNEEFSFLYKNCVRIRSSVISELVFAPEFMEALRGYDKTLNDDSVYEVLRKTYKEMVSDGRGYRTAKKIIKKISKDVTGDSSSWCNE